MKTYNKPRGAQPIPSEQDILQRTLNAPPRSLPPKGAKKAKKRVK